LDAIERLSLARAVLVAMEMCLAFAFAPRRRPGPGILHPGEGRGPEGWIPALGPIKVLL
jgi:hypothetical protein